VSKPLPKVSDDDGKDDNASDDDDASDDNDASDDDAASDNQVLIVEVSTSPRWMVLAADRPLVSGPQAPGKAKAAQAPAKLKAAKAPAKPKAAQGVPKPKPTPAPAKSPAAQRPAKSPATQDPAKPPRGRRKPAAPAAPANFVQSNPMWAIYVSCGVSCFRTRPNSADAS
jgi:hypothetical protein